MLRKFLRLCQYFSKNLPNNGFWASISAMAITRGAKKAHRASLRKRVYNTRRKEKVSRVIKQLKKHITAGDKKAAEAQMREVQKAFDKAVKGDTLKANTASRKKSRLSKQIKKLS